MGAMVRLTVLLLLSGCSDWRTPPQPKEGPGRQLELAALAKRRSDEKALQRALQRIFVWHRRHNPVAARALRPGLSDEQIDALTKDLPFRLPSELRVLYRWRDGGTPGIPFVGYHGFLSLEQAVAFHRRNRRWRRWGETWLPVFEFEHESYFVICDGFESPKPIRYLFLEEPHYWVSFTNLTTMMQTAAESMEKGAVWVVEPESGAMEQDLALVSAIHERLNPGALFPYYADEEPGRSPRRQRAAPSAPRIRTGARRPGAPRRCR